MRLYSVLVLIFLTSCATLSNPSLPVDEYGELYFTMECVWRTHNDGQTLWWCSSEVNTDLMTGYLFLELLKNDKLSFCGENLVLNTGHNLHDNLISAMTDNRFNCITIEETELGNEFDWLWYKEDRTL